MGQQKLNAAGAPLWNWQNTSEYPHDIARENCFSVSHVWLFLHCTFKYLQPFIVCGVKEESVFNFQFSSHKPVLSGRWACSECRPTTLVQQCLNQIDNVMLFMVEVRCKQKNSISNSRRVLFKMYFFKSLLKIEPNYCL